MIPSKGISTTHALIPSLPINKIFNEIYIYISKIKQTNRCFQRPNFFSLARHQWNADGVVAAKSLCCQLKTKGNTIEQFEW